MKFKTFLVNLGLDPKHRYAREVRTESPELAGARQDGKSSYSRAYVVWKMIHNPNYSVGLLSPNRRMNTDFIQKIVQMLEKLNLEGMIKKVNKTSIEFQNNSRLYSEIPSKFVFKGRTSNIILLDEPGYISDIDNIYKDIIPALATTGGTLIITKDSKELIAN